MIVPRSVFPSLMASLLLATSTPAGAAAGPTVYAAERLASAAEGAIRHLEQNPPQDPIGYLSLAVLHRRFPIAAFRDMRARYLQALAAAKDDQLRTLRVFLRLLHHAAPSDPEDLAAINEGIDLVTSRALHCDRLGLPSDYQATVREAAEAGGYFLTHVALALKWVRENGCDTEWTRSLEAAILARVAEIPNADSQVTDLELEAATLLYYWGRDDLVPDGFLGAVLAAQGDDGGWSPDSESQATVRHWHPTSLALWMLLEMATQSEAPMVPRPPGP